MYYLDHNLDLAGMFLGYFFINRNNNWICKISGFTEES